jgi:hypothetical protein
LWITSWSRIATSTPPRKVSSLRKNATNWTFKLSNPAPPNPLTHCQPTPTLDISHPFSPLSLFPHLSNVSYVPYLIFCVFDLSGMTNISNLNLSKGTIPPLLKYKIVFLGDQAVGKSSIINRFIYDIFDGN